MELIGERGMIRYTESGSEIELRNTELHPHYPGYTILGKNKQTIPNDLKRYQWHVLDHLYKHLIDDVPINSNGKSAIKTLEVIENIIKLCE